VKATRSKPASSPPQYLSSFVSGGLTSASQAPIMLATVVGIIATALQIGYLLLRKRKVDGMLWVSAVVIVVMGGLTIYLHNENFIKWKPTILYWAFALALIVAQLFFKKNLAQKAMGHIFNPPEPLWNKVNAAWITFFVAIGLLNLFVAFVMFKDDTSAWVSFKVFGATGIFFAFFIAQAMFLWKYVKEEQA
jgi:intracellular septation protein